MIPNAPNSEHIPVNRPPANGQSEVRQASPAQIAANRLNAQKSTGPRTEAGKAIASRNSEKHTKLARTLLVASQSHLESSSEFSALCDEYYESLDPVGPLEEMLVDRIVSAVWRLRRARHVESGEIALNLEKTDQKSDEINPVPTLLKAAEATDREDVLKLLEKSIPGCEYVLTHLREARVAVQREQQLTPDIFHRLNSAFRCRAKTLIDPLYQMAMILGKNPAKLDPVILLEEHQRQVMELLDQQIQYFEEILANRRADPDAATRARQDAAMLPTGHVLERILRYETVLERQIFGSMAQLEKLQSRRRQSESSARS
jgi:hypothetical protein